ncbi:MAG: discoidin domain-containing protein [Pyrinomonadaceae bacterium]
MLKNKFTVLILVAFLCGNLQTNISARPPKRAIITVNASQPANEFEPCRDLGAGIDGNDFGEINRILSARNIDEMQTVGFKPLTYRLRTELAIDAWHWNPQGAWSDAKNEQGYWTSADNAAGEPISLCYGYHLPRRGSTIDQANNDGYSRITDGDPNSFWKSNPYLDERFTGEDNRLHEQWIVLDLGRAENINAIKILWGAPFALEYEVQYGDVRDTSDISQNPPDLWRDFPRGTIETKIGGEIQTKLSDAPVKTRFVRVLLERSSRTAPENSNDIRDNLGFAVREIYLGKLDGDGRLQDVIRHTRSAKKQTITYVSSTDSWHRAEDFDKNTEHIGFDRLYQSGLTNGLPVLTPVSLLYGTPENAAAEIHYLLRKNYKVEQVEMGEEPDGQYITPEDYGALYVQWANAIHAVDPKIKLGGPSFQEILPDTRGYKTELGNAVWFERFINYLEKRKRAADFSFLSFEWYPFDDVCRKTAPQLAEMPQLLADSLKAFQKHGLKPNVPVLMTEYGYSAFAARAEVDIEGALFNADTVGKFLTLRGAGAYLYGYEPNNIEKEMPCTAGNNMLFLRDENGNIRYKTATYYGARLMMREWLESSGKHQIYVSYASGAKNKAGQSLVDAYAVKRPDGKWSLMLINKDSNNALSVNIRFLKENNKTLFQGKLDAYSFSKTQYQWSEKLARPTKSNPPEHKVIQADETTQYDLPPYSLTVLRGDITEPR